MPAPADQCYDDKPHNSRWQRVLHQFRRQYRAKRRADVWTEHMRQLLSSEAAQSSVAAATADPSDVDVLVVEGGFMPILADNEKLSAVLEGIQFAKKGERATAQNDQARAASCLAFSPLTRRACFS